VKTFGTASSIGNRLLRDYSQYTQLCRSIKSTFDSNEQNRQTFALSMRNIEVIYFSFILFFIPIFVYVQNMYLTAVELRHEQDEIIANLQEELTHFEQVINQTNEIDDVETLDETYEELNTHFEIIRTKLESILSSPDHRHSSTLITIQQRLQTISNQVIHFLL
jgi:hypothetical protein